MPTLKYTFPEEWGNVCQEGYLIFKYPVNLGNPYSLAEVVHLAQRDWGKIDTSQVEEQTADFCDRVRTKNRHNSGRKRQLNH